MMTKATYQIVTGAMELYVLVYADGKPEAAWISQADADYLDRQMDAIEVPFEQLEQSEMKAVNAAMWRTA